jgi:hypothetical protein
MDYMSNKAIMIGVGIFVTVIITSSILGIVGQIKGIYAKVFETSISIQENFSEFDMYNNTQKSGLDLLNAAKKYNNDALVEIRLGASILNNDVGIQYIRNNLQSPSGVIRYETIYTTTVDRVPGTDKIVIQFR